MKIHFLVLQITVPALLATGLMHCSRKQSETELKSTSSAEAPVKEVPSAPAKAAPVESISSLDHLNSIIDETPGKLLVFDLYADWCSPCKMLAPVFSSLAATHGNHARFFRIDVQNNPDIASAFGVRGIPYVVFIKDKEVVHALTGLNPKETYERVITTCGSSITVGECRAGLENSL